MTLLTSVYTAVLYINICCFISDFRPVVNSNYVSSPKFVQSRNGSPNLRRLLNIVLAVFEAFQQTAYGIFLCDNL